MTILERIVARKREEVAERRRQRPPAALRDAPVPPRRDFAAALRRRGLSAICEIKRRSPSRGVLRANLDPAALARDYERGGAAALSVLTDHDFFGGAEDDLSAARDAAALPVLRKDFTIDPYQLLEARSIGADAVLLIVRILDDSLLGELAAQAAELGLAALVEVHDENELERAVAAECGIIGVNSRNLDTFEVSLETALRLLPMIPAGCTSVAESGIHTHADVRRLEQAGYDAILVGESLVVSDDPRSKLAELLGAPR